MKKIIYSIFAVALIATLFVGCSKSPDKVLPRKDGVWNYTATISGAGYFESFAGKMTFTESGVTITDDSDPTDITAGTWSYDKSSEKLTLIIDGDALIFAVSDASRTKETWTYSENGVTWTFKLTKK